MASDHELHGGLGRTLPGWRTGVVLAGWLALVLVGLSTGAFWARSAEEPPLLLLFAILGPAAMFAAAYRLSPAFRVYVLSLDLRLLTAVQAWRVGGGVFIAVHAQGLLPGLFAYPAGYGDIFTGAFAVFALMALINRTPGWQTQLVRLNYIGLVDFAGAVGTGVLASQGPLGLLRGAVSTEALQHYPLDLIPTFAVPLWILVHIASLIQLRRIRAESAMTANHAPATA
ncbi:MAG: hypothetical protein HYR63_00535 [Proteobacteria bacterium]|nr:hypothetical protein [Pseudomonadota bacterium]MBI3499306.1 hypothetical protein [Pseudomonadota bacterium]